VLDLSWAMLDLLAAAGSILCESMQRGNDRSESTVPPAKLSMRTDHAKFTRARANCGRT
jgi:hypothetical protein